MSRTHDSETPPETCEMELATAWDDEFDVAAETEACTNPPTARYRVTATGGEEVGIFWLCPTCGADHERVEGGA